VDARARQFNTRYAGKAAGFKRPDGYIEVRLDGRIYLAHRLIWLIHFGSWPCRDVDHRDRVPGNNRIDNLRLATATQNMQNQTIRVNNTSGVKGVYFDKGTMKWRAQIVVNGRAKYIGIYGSIVDAQAARRKAANENFGEFATGGVAA